MFTEIDYNNSLCHYGIKGQQWGERRYQNEDGSYTALGREHRAMVDHKAVKVDTSNFKPSKSNSSSSTPKDSKEASGAAGGGGGSASPMTEEEKKKLEEQQKNKSSVMKNGSSGPEVAAMQQQLIDAGYDLHEFGANGKFGRRTKAAVEAFQRDHGLKVDGLVGPETLEALKNLKNEPKTEESTKETKTKSTKTKKANTSKTKTKTQTKTQTEKKKETKPKEEDPEAKAKIEKERIVKKNNSTHKSNFKKALKTTSGKAYQLNSTTSSNLAKAKGYKLNPVTQANLEKKKKNAINKPISRTKLVTTGPSSVKELINSNGNIVGHYKKR